MLETVLTVLKIIGIILLSIIGIVLLLLLLLLFWPFFYKIDGKKEERFEGKVTLSWLLHFVVVEALFLEGFNLRIKILGIPFYDKNRKAKKEEVNENHSGKEKLSEKNKKEESGKEDLKGDHLPKEEALLKEEVEVIKNGDPDSPGIEEKTAADEKTNETGKQFQSKEDSVSKESDPSGKAKKKPISQRILEAIEKIFSFLEALPDKIEEICQKAESKVEELIEWIAYYDNLFSKKGTAWVIDFCKKELLLILKHLKPYKASIDLQHRSEDPEKVAKMYQYYGMALPFLPKKTSFSSDFGEEMLHFKIRMKGKFFLFYLVFHVLKLILNKKVKKFIKLVKREEL